MRPLKGRFCTLCTWRLVHFTEISVNKKRNPFYHFCHIRWFEGKWICCALIHLLPLERSCLSSILNITKSLMLFFSYTNALQKGSAPEITMRKIFYKLFSHFILLQLYFDMNYIRHVVIFRYHRLLYLRTFIK